MKSSMGKHFIRSHFLKQFDGFACIGLFAENVEEIREDQWRGKRLDFFLLHKREKLIGGGGMGFSRQKQIQQNVAVKVDFVDQRYLLVR